MNTFRSKAMSNEEATVWLKKFHRALGKGRPKFGFKKDLTDPRTGRKIVTREKWGIPGNIAALHEPDENRILFNPSRRVYGGIVKMAIHELLHRVDDNLNEDSVTKLENLIYEALTDQQLWNLMKKVFK